MAGRSYRGGGGGRSGGFANRGRGYFRGKSGSRAPKVKGGKVVGYKFFQKGGLSHSGITNQPARRQGEHVRNSGANGFLKVVTGAMSRAQGRKWEGRQNRTRGYN